MYTSLTDVGGRHQRSTENEMAPNVRHKYGQWPWSQKISGPSPLINPLQLQISDLRFLVYASLSLIPWLPFPFLLPASLEILPPAESDLERRTDLILLPSDRRWVREIGILFAELRPWPSATSMPMISAILSTSRFSFFSSGILFGV